MKVHFSKLNISRAPWPSLQKQPSDILGVGPRQLLWEAGTRRDSTAPRLSPAPWGPRKTTQRPARGALRWRGQGWAAGPQPSTALTRGTLPLPHLTEGRLAEGPRVPQQQPRDFTHLGGRAEDLQGHSRGSHGWRPQTPRHTPGVSRRGPADPCQPGPLLASV